MELLIEGGHLSDAHILSVHALPDQIPTATLLLNTQNLCTGVGWRGVGRGGGGNGHQVSCGLRYSGHSNLHTIHTTHVKYVLLQCQ